MHIYEITKTKRKRLLRKDFENTRFYGVDILSYALNGYGNLENKNMRYADIIYTNIENVILPKEKDIFQLIEGKNLSYVKMPTFDYTNYDFSGVHLYNTLFPNDAYINPATDIFQNIYNKSISYSYLPTGDYSKVDFSEVDMRGSVFNKESILPNCKNFLKSLKDKSIAKMKIYNGLYDKWDFDGIDIEYVTFGLDFILPKGRNIFKCAKNSSIKGCTFIRKDLSTYNLNNVDITECTFIDCKFPDDYDWVQSSKNKSIVNCSFINCDLSKISLKDVNIAGCRFKGSTKINIYENLFQDIHEKRATEVTLPKGDYSLCNFKDVDLSYSVFTYYSIFPYKYNIFKEMKKYSYIKLPYNAMKNLHLYALDKYNLCHIKNTKKNMLKNKCSSVLIYFKTELKKEGR